MTSKRQDRLGAYAKRRDFRKTPEPRAKTQRGARHGAPIFVIQEHDATTLHYDFRIEMDGVLVSWAVPRGPSTDPREKRLAVRTEDHPLEYADFEGVIPAREYGAGSVIVWDRGTYENMSTDENGDELPLAQALERGHADIWLEGKKLRGGYALIHSRMRDRDQNWLLVKMRDEGADARRNPTRTQPKSVLSDRTIDDLEESP